MYTLGSLQRKDAPFGRCVIKDAADASCAHLIQRRWGQVEEESRKNTHVELTTPCVFKSKATAHRSAQPAPWLCQQTRFVPET